MAPFLFKRPIEVIYFANTCIHSLVVYSAFGFDFSLKKVIYIYIYIRIL